MRRKINKTPCIVDGISNHVFIIIYAPPCYIIVLLQNPLYFHYDPKTKVSVKDTSAIRNDRGIALSRLRPKVFDNCIISLTSVVLRSNHLQFAYKNRCSTIQCVSMVTEVINYYRWQLCLYVYDGCIQGI